MWLLNEITKFYSLIRNNIKGNIYRAIKSLYSKTWACVRIQNSTFTDFFLTNTGVRQGDNLSPTLFALYINDLVTELKNLGVGIEINNTMVSLLLFADDLVLISENEKDLQLLLDKFGDWCEKWNVKVNESKSKIMHFRPKRYRATDYRFKYLNSELDFVRQYKYLGVMFNEHLTFEKCSEILADAGGRALGSIISKCKKLKDCSFRTFDKLYNAGVVPIIDYGSATRGFKDYKCIDNLQNRAMRYYLGVNKFAPVIGIEGETGSIPAKLRRYKSILSFWNRMIEMNENRLTKIIFEWDYHLQRNNWSCDTKNIFAKCNLASKFERKEKCSVSDMISLLFFDDYKDNWAMKVQQKPKLRTYKLFKTDFNPEKYLFFNLPKHKRSILAQFRLGILPLNIETGRYKNVTDDKGQIRKQKPEERLCTLCAMGSTEDEFHFLFDCECYSSKRNTLLNKVSLQNRNFSSLSRSSKLEFLMKNSVNNLCNYLCASWEIRKELLFNKC